MALPGIILGITARKYGSLEAVVQICAALNFTGGVIRHMSVFTGNFWYVLIGNIFIASAQTMLSICVGVVSNKWFAENERNLSTTIIVNGESGSLILCGLFTITLLTQEDFEKGFNTLMNAQTIILITCAVLSVFLIPNKPERPPSKVALQEETPLESFSSIF
jgi:hypothetical protein